MIKAIIAVVGGTILLTAGIVLLNNNNQEIGGKIELTPLTVDLGAVSMADGNIHTEYEVKNIGKENLKIDSIWTSCMCTTATLNIGNETSPVFGMHNNSSFWSQEIKPGQKAVLEVIFDPAFHGPQGVGQLTRAIYLSTSDPLNKKAEARFTINVTQ